MRRRTVLILVTGTVLALPMMLLAARSVIFDWYRTSSAAMAPTIPADSHFLPVLKCAYQIRIPFSSVRLFRTGSPRRGDVVVLRNPDGKPYPFVQRVVGLPGDTVEMRNEVLVLNGAVLPLELDKTSNPSEEELLGRTRLGDVEFTIRVLPNRPAFRTFGPVSVPSGEVFLLGDNRDESRDSRFYGTRPLDDLLGRLLTAPARPSP